MPFLAIISMIASVLFYVLVAITMLRLLKALDIYIKKNKINWKMLIKNVLLLIFLFYEFLTLDYISSLRLYCTTTWWVSKYNKVVKFIFIIYKKSMCLFLYAYNVMPGEKEPTIKI